jgi:hypothetical protein
LDDPRGNNCAAYDVYHATKDGRMCMRPLTKGDTLETAARYVPVHVSKSEF